MTTLKCENCHKSYQAKRKTSRYCTDNCRVKAAKRRKEKQPKKEVSVNFSVNSVNDSVNNPPAKNDIENKYISLLENTNERQAEQLRTKDAQIEHLHAMQKATAVQVANLQQSLNDANEQKAIAQNTIDTNRAGKQRRDRLRYWRQKRKAATTDDARAKCEAMIRENGGQ